jgi:hypothetical protein
LLPYLPNSLLCYKIYIISVLLLVISDKRYESRGNELTGYELIKCITSIK